MTGSAVSLTRRQFGKAAGALVLAFSLVPRLAGAQAPKLPGSLANNRMLDAWLRINADGSATIFTGKVELGQGEYGGTAVRLACAEARALLVGEAAKRLGQPVERLTVSDGVVATPDGRKLGYGELAAELDLDREVTATVAPKPAAQHAIVGRPVPRHDIPGKVTGGAAYVQDFRLPGMLHGRVVRPPRYGARIEALDDAPIRAMPGILAVVREGSFLGVVAEREEQAVKAREALARAARWSGGTELPDPARLVEHLVAMPTQSSVVSEKQGAAAAATRTLEATYTRPYIAHAAIGPSCAVAELGEGTLRVWTHSQGVFPLRRDLAKALKLDARAVRCTHIEGSGCYGHNGADDVALDAALLARAVAGRPVRVQWMRDDEFAWEPYGSAMLMRNKAGLDANGRIVDWVYQVWSNTHSTRPAAPGDDNNLLASWYLAEPSQPGPPTNIPQPAGGGDRNAVPLYDFPNQRVVNHLISEMPLRVSALRTLGAYANVFAIESFMDELAAAAGQDPVGFRLAHLVDPRARAVIEAAVKKAGWKAGETGNGVRGRGFGFAKYKNLATYVAVVAEIKIDPKTGHIRVPRAFAIADAGQIINPDGLANQIEGGMIQSTSWTLHEAVRFDRDGITFRDWSGYPILTMPEVPEIEVTLIDRPDEKSLGAGEAAQGPMAAAIANAFAHATSRRLRDLPFIPDRVRSALG
jgi:CO/xanthine dehydrogenase Mo-binding subunit